MPKNKYFTSDFVYSTAIESIDEEKGVIRGVKVCSEGEAKGHGVWLNKKFIRNVTKFGKEHDPGIKARFGHPNMCATSLGTYIGRYKNYRTQTEEREEWEGGARYHSVADLYLDETAKNLPKLGDAWGYIMKLAKSSPDMFGNSIVFTPGENEVTVLKSKDGSTQERIDSTIKILHATDIVDDPAATDGLFSVYESEELSAQVTNFLDTHPEVYDIALKHPEIIETFLNKYESYKNKKDMNTDEMKSFSEKLDKLTDWVGKLFTTKEPAVVEEVLQEPITTPEMLQFEADKAEFEQIKTDFEAEKLAFEIEKQEVEKMKLDATQLTTELRELKNSWVPEPRQNDVNGKLKEVKTTGIDRDRVKEVLEKIKDK